ncbi:topoisomerase DNA-binding C4 zinc finger domain-containing protein [Pseudomonas sp. NPDC007930]|uniref:topoisomerase DNA-binding C4 zinc finger domain-containing protein n=1 Tax=Pseudomonas sp. NPDC007930 TaxID=3364417 RepID=UPI0036E4B422
MQHKNVKRRALLVLAVLALSDLAVARGGRGGGHGGGRSWGRGGRSGGSGGAAFIGIVLAIGVMWWGASAIFGRKKKPKTNQVSESAPPLQKPAERTLPRVLGDEARTDSKLCPQCGKAMQRRFAKRGRYAGRAFFGCSAYPKCRGIRPE